MSSSGFVPPVPYRAPPLPGPFDDYELTAAPQKHRSFSILHLEKPSNAQLSALKSHLDIAHSNGLYNSKDVSLPLSLLAKVSRHSLKAVTAADTPIDTSVPSYTCLRVGWYLLMSLIDRRGYWYAGLESWSSSWIPLLPSLNRFLRQLLGPFESTRKCDSSEEADRLYQQGRENAIIQGYHGITVIGSTIHLVKPYHSKIPSFDLSLAFTIYNRLLLLDTSSWGSGEQGLLSNYLNLYRHIFIIDNSSSDQQYFQQLARDIRRALLYPDIDFYRQNLFSTPLDKASFIRGDGSSASFLDAFSFPEISPPEHFAPRYAIGHPGTVQIPGPSELTKLFREAGASCSLDFIGMAGEFTLSGGDLANPLAPLASAVTYPITSTAALFLLHKTRWSSLQNKNDHPELIDAPPDLIQKVVDSLREFCRSQPSLTEFLTSPPWHAHYSDVHELVDLGYSKALTTRNYTSRRQWLTLEETMYVVPATQNTSGAFGTAENSPGPFDFPVASPVDSPVDPPVDLPAAVADDAGDWQDEPAPPASSKRNRAPRPGGVLDPSPSKSSRKKSPILLAPKPSKKVPNIPMPPPIVIPPKDGPPSARTRNIEKRKPSALPSPEKRPARSVALPLFVETSSRPTEPLTPTRRSTRSSGLTSPTRPSAASSSQASPTRTSARTSGQSSPTRRSSPRPASPSKSKKKKGKGVLRAPPEATPDPEEAPESREIGDSSVPLANLIPARMIENLPNQPQDASLPKCNRCRERGFVCVRRGATTNCNKCVADKQRCSLLHPDEALVERTRAEADTLSEAALSIRKAINRFKLASSNVASARLTLNLAQVAEREAFSELLNCIVSGLSNHGREHFVQLIYGTSEEQTERAVRRLRDIVGANADAVPPRITLNDLMDRLDSGSEADLFLRRTLDDLTESDYLDLQENESPTAAMQIEPIPFRNATPGPSGSNRSEAPPPDTSTEFFTNIFGPPNYTPEGDAGGSRSSESEEEESSVSANDPGVSSDNPAPKKRLRRETPTESSDSAQL